MRERRRTVMSVLSQGETPSVAAAERPSPEFSEHDDAESLPDMPKTSAKKTTPRKSKRPARKYGGSSEPPREGRLLRLRRALYRPKVLLLIAAGLVATAVIPRVADWLPDPREREEYRFDPAEIEITPPPHDVPPDLVDQVLRRSRFPESVSLLEEELTEKIAKAFAAHPWVAEVVSVKKSFPPQVRVALKYRKPVAMVEVSDGMYPIDAGSVLLPPEDFSMADTRRYPLIRSVQTQPQGPAGTRWGDVVVHGAAKLADTLQPHWKDLQLAAIIVPRRTAAQENLDDLKFELRTVGGSRILWGRAPGSKHPGELTAEQKIGRLRKYLADFGRFDHPHGPYEIDIRHWQEITRRPLPTAGRSRDRR